MSGVVVVQPGLDARDVVATIRPLCGEVLACTFGDDEASIAAAGFAEPDRVVVLGGYGPGEPVPAETAAPDLAEACRRRDVELVVLPASASWREVAAQLAVHLDAACVTDAVSVGRDDDGSFVAERLIYGGLAIATVSLRRRPAIVTMVFPAGDRIGAASGVEVETEEAATRSSPRELIERVPVEATVDLTAARRIVAVGRGLRDRADLDLIEGLAAAMDAELGCSRPLAEDLHWLPLERQVGLTGTTVKPDLYLAIGISGQIQHLVGMRDSRVIVAINSNASAPIFRVVDIGVVGDLYEIVPRLSAALQAR